MKNTERFIEYADFAQEKPFSLRKNSSIGVGGEAAIAFIPQSVEELQRLVQKLAKDGLDYYVLGNLTNVLPPDHGTEKAIVLTKGLRAVSRTEKGVFVSAGVMSGALINVCKQARVSGAEFLHGVPCTLGGALYMNAGAGGKYIHEIVESVLVLRQGEKRLLPVSECGYAYKKSVFMENGDIILGANLRLQQATQTEIEERLQYYAARRKHLPKGKSMGCVFKNPSGEAAGELIERSGLKGMRVGGAKIAEEHANFVINDRGATANDIRALIKLMKNAVSARYGIELEEEIRYLT